MDENKQHLGWNMRMGLGMCLEINMPERRQSLENWNHDPNEHGIENIFL